MYKCILKSYIGYNKLPESINVPHGLNTEAERFMRMLITTDPLHIPNHLTCNQAFHSTQYDNLNLLNREAAEQFNSLLRHIQTSLTYMTYENYMLSLQVFVSFHNMK